MGPPGAPFRLGPGAKCPSCPPPPPPVGGPGYEFSVSHNAGIGAQSWGCYSKNVTHYILLVTSIHCSVTITYYSQKISH